MQNRQATTLSEELIGHRLSSKVDLRTAASPASYRSDRAVDAPSAGLLVVNADDWGRDRVTTDRILECGLRGAVSSVSAMVFMEDSDRAAALAREHGIKAGLHLNFTTPFSGSGCPSGLLKHQRQLAQYLRHRFAQVVFHPGLTRSFEYLVACQLDEFRRIYGGDPEKLDGHHHMHLCANVLLQRLLPPGTIVRRNFSFKRGEKGPWNRLYRSLVDHSLARRHRLVDFFFSLPPLEPENRLLRIYSLARQFVVELETHPVRPDEYRYLAGGKFFRDIGDIQFERHVAVPQLGRSTEGNSL
jgi:chitin disaccharide deacetylase